MDNHWSNYRCSTLCPHSTPGSVGIKNGVVVYSTYPQTFTTKWLTKQNLSVSQPKWKWPTTHQMTFEKTLLFNYN